MSDGIPEITFSVYQDASPSWSKDVSVKIREGAAEITLPENAVSGDSLHIIVKAETKGHYRLTHYQQVIITVK